jgi:hypothetical protein
MHPHAQFKTVIDMMTVEQGKLPVEDYAEKLETAINLAEPDISEISRVIVFIKRLNPEICKTMLLQPSTKTLIEAISNVIDIEDGLKIIKPIGATVNFAE